VGGLPGSGKSTLAQALAEHGQLRLIRSDVVRKELAGLAASESAHARLAEGHYSQEWTDRTYAECLNRAEKLLMAGERVIVDAKFGEEMRRRAFLDAAARLGVPALFFLCRADPEVARLRLQTRRGDASDADESVYRRAAERWEEESAGTRRLLLEIPTNGTKDEALACALQELRTNSLLG